MYSIEINLLRERTNPATGEQSEFINNTLTSAPTSKGNKIPMFIGAGVAVLSLFSAGAGWMLLGQQTGQLEAKQKDLDQKLGSLQAQDARLAALNTQVTQVEGESQSLASVFNQVQPWSAVLQDLKESIPQGVRIEKVVQTSLPSVTVAAAVAPATPATSGGIVAKISTPPDPEAKAKPSPAVTPSPAAATVPSSPATSTTATKANAPATATPAASTPTVAAAPLPAEVPTTKLNITGTAKSFDEVNNFILTLKQSAFFNPDETQLTTATLMEPVVLTPVSAAGQPITGQTPDKVTKFQIPKVVKYEIQTTLKRVPAADLMRELERKGAVGLVARLRSLQQQQVTKP
jgi:type IV pilus assembly protein PilN